MPALSPPEVERRALALFEHLADAPDNTRLRTRLLRNEPEAVLTRLKALEDSVTRARGAIPTLIPGSADCEGALPPPERVGAFRLVERIGRGGMGDVWLGQRDDGLYEQKVAVKLIQRHALARAATAFEDERRFLARLEHPNIARLIDGGVTEDGLPWLAMEFFDGQPIDTACQPLADGARVSLFIKAVDAVRYAHSRMVAHADLKPSNILVDGDGRVKLLDFGIAGLIGDESRSPTGSGPLTREFASPERLAGEGPSVADDVFALGKTLRLVLQGTGDAELKAVATKAQDEDASERYGSAADLITDLDRWRARLPVSAMPDGWNYRAGKFIERHRTGVLATGAALILLSATSLIATSSYVRAERTRISAEHRFNEVRHLSHFMLFDLYDELARSPGTVAKRAEIARTAALYLERLQISGETPADLRLDTARSYRRLAAIEGLPAVSNLGQPENAQKALDKADALLADLVAEKPDEAAALAERGWVATEKWTLAADNGDSPQFNKAARGQFDAALRIDPGNALAQLGKLVTLRNDGYDLIWSANKPAAALPVLQSALASLRSRSWPTALHAQAKSLEIGLLNRLGDATYYAGDVPGSLPFYQQADSLIRRAISAEGATPQLVIAQGEQAFNISGTLGDMGGRAKDALAVADDGVAKLQSLLAYGPDAAAEKWLLVLYGQQALLLEQSGRIDVALTPSGKSIALRSERLRRSPENPQRMRDLAVGLMPYAELLAKADRGTDACNAAKKSLSTWQDIAARKNLGALDAGKNLPRSEALVKNLCPR